MTSRQFQTQALLQAHALAVTDYLSGASDKEISLETADQLADLAGLLAKRLTVEWENSMVWSQKNDLKIKDGTSVAYQQDSTTNLQEPFEPVEFVKTGKQTAPLNFQPTGKALVH
jgi:hypothetical protein